MTNLTTNQFDTFIDIISSEDYHAPLWSDDENALRNKGLLTSPPRLERRGRKSTFEAV